MSCKIKALALFFSFFLFISVISFISVTPVIAALHTSSMIPGVYQKYGTPRDVITLSNGDMWYADSQNHRIVKINSSGDIIRTVGRQGSGEGEFACNGPTSITQDNNGFLYALDECNVYKFDYNGGYISSWGGLGDTPDTAELNGAYVIHFSNYSGELLVSDTNHNRVARFSTSGTYLGQFGSACTYNTEGDPNSGCVTPLVDGEFDGLAGLTTDSSGNIYIVDSNNHRIQVFSNDYSFSFKFGSNEEGDYYLQFPKDVEILTNGDIVVTSQNSQTIKKFTSQGVYITQFGQSGTNDNDFNRPEFLTKANDDSLWIVDSVIKKFVHYSNTGTYLGYLGNSSSTLAGKFTNPFSLDFDNQGNMYVLDSTGRVQKFDSNGSYISTIIEAESIPSSPSYNIAISPFTQNIFISSLYHVSVFNIGGTMLGTLGNHDVNQPGLGTGDFNDPRGMAFDSSGNIFVADMYNNRIQKFNPSLMNEAGGGFLSEISLIGAGRTWRGEWNSGTTYSTNDLVFSYDENHHYISLQDDNLEHAVTNTDWWRIWTPSGNGEMALPANIFIDDQNNIYISPESGSGESGSEVLKIEKFNSNGVWQSTHLNQYGWPNEANGNYRQIRSFVIDDGGLTYLPEPDYDGIYVYGVGGSWIETLGSSGDNEDQYDNPSSVRINPVTNDIVIVDSDNHRIHMLKNGVKINNLTSSADIIDTSSQNSLVTNTVNPQAESSNNITAQMLFGNYLVSDFNVDLTSDRDWSAVNTVLLPDKSKSLIVNLNPSDAPGVSETHSLYITKQQGQDHVVICPNATTIADIGPSCADAYTLHLGDPGLSIETINSQEYWKIAGLTGTGGFSPVISTFNLNNPGSLSVNEKFNITITAKNDEGITENDYTGTIHFSANPNNAILPADYTYTTSDNGVHTFSNLSFTQSGTYNLTIVDTIDSSRTQTIEIIVTDNSSQEDNSSPSDSPSSSGSSSSAASSPVCNDQKPENKAPQIWKIESLGSGKIKIYFNDADKPTTSYHLVFGTKPDKYTYGGINIANFGDASFTVSQLKTNKKYFFRLIPQNGCASGTASNEFSFKIPGYFSNLISKVTNVKPAISTENITPTPGLSAPSASPSKAIIKKDEATTPLLKKENFFIRFLNLFRKK